MRARVPHQQMAEIRTRAARGSRRQGYVRRQRDAENEQGAVRLLVGVVVAAAVLVIVASVGRVGGVGEGRGVEQVGVVQRVADPVDIDASDGGIAAGRN